MAFNCRAEEYELKRALALIFSKEEMLILSKGVRTALQQIVILRAGCEVNLEGKMHLGPKFARYVELIESNKKKLLLDLQALASAAPFVLPDYVAAAINHSNAKGKQWQVAANANSWKRFTEAKAKCRNHVLPYWRSLFGNKPLPSGKSFDEYMEKFIVVLSTSKSPPAGSSFLY